MAKKHKIYYYTRRKAVKKGRRDGRDFTWKFWPFWKNPKTPYPLLDQANPPQYEDELISLSRKEVAEVNDIWIIKDKKLKTDYCLARNNFIKAEEAFLKEQAEVAPQEANVHKITEELLNHPAAPISHRTALLFHFFVFVGELFFNAIVFNIFGFEIHESYLVAAVLGVALTILAYFTGKLLKKDNRRPNETLVLYLMPIMALFGIIAISVLRSKYLGEMMENPDTSFGIDMSVSLAATMFIIINIVIFIGGAVISFMSFTRDETYLETLKKQYKTAIRQLEKESGEAFAAAARLKSAQATYIAAREQRKKEFESYQTWAKYVIAEVELLVEAYRTANMEARRDAKKPICFTQLVEPVELPDELHDESLDWNCTVPDGPLTIKIHQN